MQLIGTIYITSVSLTNVYRTGNNSGNTWGTFQTSLAIDGDNLVVGESTYIRGGMPKAGPENFSYNYSTPLELNDSSYHYIQVGTLAVSTQSNTITVSLEQSILTIDIIKPASSSIVFSQN